MKTQARIEEALARRGDDAAGTPGADAVMRRLLFLPAGPVPSRSREIDSRGYRLVNLSLALSGLRCVITYVLFPVLAPALGAASLIGPAVGVPVAGLALIFDVMALRRFWAANHRLRWTVTPIYLGLMGLVAALLAIDLTHLTR
ncbi:MAG TPA: hypothetical protein VE990_14515 [Acidimicrobiales bacterium]|nr:hypothetical protein [Acidimicrobiales bacterium]